MEMDLDSMTVAELRKALKSRSLKQGGKKSELKERLLTAIQSEVIQESANQVDDNQHTDFADFEEYINDEYNRLNKGTQHHTIDDIINDPDDEEKDILLDLNDHETPKEVIVADFNDDSLSLNPKSKVEDRKKRFGTNPIDNNAQIESRKRRFESESTNTAAPPIKKQKVDLEGERSKIFKRAQKFGTNLPKNFKLTKEESALMYKDEIERAKRFGTEHLLPIQIKRAEMDAKREERKKRFKGNEADITENEKEKTPSNGNNTKLMERKLRFGTMNDGDKQMERKKRFGTNGKKVNNARQFRNNERFEKFRAYKKNNRGYKGGNRGKRGGFNGYNNGGFNRKSGLVFNDDDLKKINQRKMRFNAM